MGKKLKTYKVVRVFRELHEVEASSAKEAIEIAFMGHCCYSNECIKEFARIKKQNKGK